MSVTVIEVALIATIMLSENGVPTLARDTVFAVVMIVCNGLVGICILVGGLRYREQDFQVTGANVYLSVLVVLATITLILPNYTETTPGPIYSASQLGFVSVVTAKHDDRPVTSGVRCTTSNRGASPVTMHPTE